MLGLFKFIKWAMISTEKGRLIRVKGSQGGRNFVFQKSQFPFKDFVECDDAQGVEQQCQFGTRRPTLRHGNCSGD